MASGKKPLIVPLIVACALFMENLDGTIITTALPDMAVTFDTSPVRLNVAITAYLLALAIFIPISGWISDRFGGRTVFRAAIATFTLASVLCGLANSLPELTGARILQGIGGAMMVPVGRLVMLRAVPKTELVRATAWLTVPALIGPVCGPPLGGFITTYASWRYIFLLNVPIGLLGMVLVTLFIDNYREPERRPLDWQGFLLSGMALGLLIYGLDCFTHAGIDFVEAIVFLAGGAVFGVATVLHSLRHRHPLIDLSLFRITTFAVNGDAGTMFRITASALPFLLPLLMQLGFGMSAFTSGLITFSQALGAMLMKFFARPLLRRYGFRTVLIANALVVAAAIAACALLTPETPPAAMVLLIFLTGLFRSLQFLSLQTLVYSDIPPQKMSVGTSLAAMLQQLANALGVAFAAIVLQLSMAWHEAQAPAITDFQTAFLVVAAFAALGCLPLLRLAPDAASEVSGHRPKRIAAPAVGDD
jgi:EmrB/QacA subfamily drug resistance transporter